MKLSANKSIFLVLFGIFILQLFFLFNSIDFYGGADNITHFRTARYAFKYPRLFLDQWGKPVYTALVFPFSLLGIQFARLFNVLVGLAAIVLSIKIIRLSNEKFNLLPVFFIAFSPMYFLLMQSCLTEILFSFVLVLSFWLFFSEKYYWAAAALSFIPFVRTEGIVIFPIFILALILAKKYWAVPLLLIGSLFYSLVGYPHYHDWLWIFHQMPYSLGKSVYGSGSLFSFVQQSPNIFGWPFLAGLIIGLIVWTLRKLKSFKLAEKPFLFYFLIVGSFLTYFAAHSYVWWRGTGGSLGLIRVIAAVVPLAAIIAMVGFNSILSRIKNTTFQIILIFAIVVLQLVVPFKQHHLPLPIERPQALMLEASEYLKSLKETSKIYYFDPYLVHYLEIDPYDQTSNNWGVVDKFRPSATMTLGDILVWDAHFGPNEGGVLLSNLMVDPYLQLIKSLLPIEPFKVLGGFDYGIYIFRKVEQKTFLEMKPMLERELVFSIPGIENQIELEGKKLLKMDAGMEYSPGIQIPVSEIQAQNILDISASVRFLSQEKLGDDEVLLVLSINVNDKSVSYNRINLLSTVDDIRKNKEVSLPLKISSHFPQGAIISIYVWNKDKKNLLLENIKLSVSGL